MKYIGVLCNTHIHKHVHLYNIFILYTHTYIHNNNVIKYSMANHVVPRIVSLVDIYNYVIH